MRVNKIYFCSLSQLPIVYSRNVWAQSQSSQSKKVIKSKKTTPPFPPCILSASYGTRYMFHFAFAQEVAGLRGIKEKLQQELKVNRAKSVYNQVCSWQGKLKGSKEREVQRAYLLVYNHAPCF